MTTVTNSPPNSSPSSPGSHGTKTPLSLDLSAVPPLINPSPPSNTLLITVSLRLLRPRLSLLTLPQNLQDPSIFHPTHLLTIRTLINQSAPLHSFAPLKSLRRIIASFHTTPDAILIRRLLDNAPILSSRMRIYFGEPTPIDPTDQHLHAPKSSKLFFISPPPSPPHGWQMRNEEPPNKDVHADDLASALAKLHARPSAPVADAAARCGDGVEREGTRVQNRTRSGSATVVYHPRDHGDSPHLPAVMVEDTTERVGDLSPMGGVEEGREGGRMLTHTARPPVELMGDA